MEILKVLILFLTCAVISGAKISCPKECICSIDEVSCQKKNLTTIPDHLNPKIRNLDLSYNKITDIPTKLSKFTNLQELILSHNCIKRINKTHLNISSLTLLDLSYNNFSQWNQIHVDSLNHTDKILKLDLSYNRYEHIGTSRQYIQSGSLEILVMKRCIREPLPKLFLSGLKNLKKFVVSENFRLKEIDLTNASNLEHLEARNTGVELVNLSNFPNLKRAVLKGSRLNYIRTEHFNNKFLIELDLSDNGIKFIRNNSFQNLPELRELDLSMNVFVDLDPNMFMNNLMLEELVISHTYLKKLVPFNSSSLVNLDFSINEIQQFNNESLKNMPNLKYLNLCRNLISNLPNEIISHSLQYFNLSTCQISSIKESSFKNLENLRMLDLSNNKLTSFKREYFPMSLHHIKLDKNLWRCECYSSYFIDQYNYLMYPYDDLTSKRSLICHDPENVSGLTWDEACGPIWDHMHNNMLQHGKMWMYIISMVLAMSVIFCATMCIRRMHKIKIMREEAERLHQRREAQERIDRLRRESQRQIEAQQNAPDPRELQRPPSYHEAIRMPRLDSLHSLTASRPSLASIPGSPTTPGPSTVTSSKPKRSRSRDDVTESREQDKEGGRPRRSRTPRSDRRRRRRRSRAMSGDWDTRSERSMRSVDGNVDDLEVTRSMIIDTDDPSNEVQNTPNNTTDNTNNGNIENINR